jgi:hypothetical protein
MQSHSHVVMSHLQPPSGGGPGGSQTGQTQVHVVSSQLQPERGAFPSGSHTGQSHEHVVPFQLQPACGAFPSGSQTGQTHAQVVSSQLQPERGAFPSGSQIGCGAVTFPELADERSCDDCPTVGSLAPPQPTRTAKTIQGLASLTFIRATFPVSWGSGRSCRLP